MSRLEHFCLGFLLLILVVLLASLMPAPAQFFWFLRVGVPETGALFFLAALPAAIWLARKSPKFSLAVILMIAIISLYPWVSAIQVARSIPAGMARAFNEKRLDRFPLRLGQRLGPVTVETETYKDKLMWDRYRAKDVPLKARILFVHGGSWRNGTRGEYPKLLYYLASRGYEVVSLTYRLAPENPYPAATDDIQVAIDKLYDGKTPLFLAGRSSGGHLALLGAYRNADKVAGVIGIYPPVDMQWSWDHPSNPAVLNSPEALAQFLGGGPMDVPKIYREASPIFEVTEAGPPTLLIHGGRDTLVYQRQSQMLSQMLVHKHVPSYLVQLPWMEHGGDIFLYGPSGILTAWASEDFIESQLTAP